MKRHIFLILALVLLPGMAFGADYYYANTATGTEDASSCANADDIAGFNADAQSLSPGDTVYICDTEVISAQLTIPASGSIGSPITITAAPGDNPTISCADTVSTWEVSAGNVWQATLVGDPYNIVLFDGVFGNVESDTPSLDAEYDYFWDSDVLYVYSETDPDTAYSTILVGTRDSAIKSDNKDYIDISNITMMYCNNGVYVINGGNPVNVDSSYMSYCENSGASYQDTGSGGDFTNNTVYFSGNGVYYQEDPIGGNTISGNTFSYIEYTNNFGTDGHCVGIQNSSNYTIENNNMSYSKSPIAFWAASGKTSTGHVVRSNYIHNLKGGDYTAGNSIAIGAAPEAQDGVSGLDIYYNVFSNINRGIYLRKNGGGDYTNIYNNVFYDGDERYILIFDGTEEINIKNNLFLSANAGAKYIGENTTGTDLYIDYNIYYPDGSYFNWDNVNRTDFAAWQTASSQDANSSTSDPLLANAAGGNFQLSYNSPAINAGTDVSLTTDFAGMPIWGLPDIGAYEHQPRLQGVTIN